MSDWREVAQTVCGVYSLDVELLLGQIQVESGGAPTAFRYEVQFFEKYIKGNKLAKATQYGPLAACSYGLLQIMLETASEEGFAGRPEYLFDPAIGLNMGAKHLRMLLTWSRENYVQALCAYNGGKGGNDKVPYRNLDYAQRVYYAAGRSLV